MAARSQTLREFQMRTGAVGAFPVHEAIANTLAQNQGKTILPIRPVITSGYDATIVQDQGPTGLLDRSSGYVPRM